jgi:SagB-type dehydrogenase family enzyme
MSERKLRRGFEDVSMSGLFHENTKQFFLKEKAAETARRVHFKSYPRFKRITLKKDLPKKRILVQELFEGPRETEEFVENTISLDNISKMLSYSAGITHVKKEGEIIHSSRSYPSAGGTYPLETYVIILRCSGVGSGIYHYNVKLHSLELIKEGDFTSKLIDLTNNKWIGKAAVVIIISAVFQRTLRKYGDRGYRYVLFETGHLAQNIRLLASSMGMACRAVTEFIDDELNEVLDLDGMNESVVYVSALGGSQERGESMRFADKFRGLFQSSSTKR